MSSAAAHAPPETGRLRSALGAVALLLLLATGARLAYQYVSDPSIARPHDFLQVWAAGRLNAAGENPYDGAHMYALQSANRMPDTRSDRFPDGYASMMWVPPWALAVAMPVGALPVDAAQLVWGLGQLALVVALAVAYWGFCGGSARHRWVPVVLVLGSGSVWWQTVGGQNGGLLLLGLVGFLFAHRANRPVLGGACLALVAIKPHLLLPLAVGLLVDASRTGFGRRVVLGGVLALAAATAVAVAFNPSVWSQYAAATTGSASPYYPGLRDWINPTLGALVRQTVPGRPFWVQTVPALVACAAFAVYWWRNGDPKRWPEVVAWVLPLGLLTAPYGSWPSDLVLLLVPLVSLGARLEVRGATAAQLTGPLLVLVAVNVAVLLMIAHSAELYAYVFVAPVTCACAVWAARAARLCARAPALAGG